MKKYSYSLNQFKWIKGDNALYAYANKLVCRMVDGSIHPDTFPNYKSQFFIYNNKSGGFRRFRFLREGICGIDYNTGGYLIELIFESEDNIKCHIQLQPK